MSTIKNPHLQLLREHAAACTRCELHVCRNKSVFDSGSTDAALMCVGEAPGADEDLEGSPFVGASGRMLNKMLASIGLKREDVYVANIVKCRPPGNRKPAPNEIAECRHYIDRQISIVRPKVVVALGATAAETLLPSAGGITKIRGRWFEYVNPPVSPPLPANLSAQTIAVMPTYHPAYLMRVSSAKHDVWTDMKAVAAKLGLTIPVVGEAPR